MEPFSCCVFFFFFIELSFLSLFHFLRTAVIKRNPQLRTPSLKWNLVESEYSWAINNKFGDGQAEAGPCSLLSPGPWSVNCGLDSDTFREQSVSSTTSPPSIQTSSEMKLSVRAAWGPVSTTLSLFILMGQPAIPLKEKSVPPWFLFPQEFWILMKLQIAQ